jgi:hypothetical protein
MVVGLSSPIGTAARRVFGRRLFKEERNEESAMQNLAARSVFFVKDAERSLSFYTGALGFALDWNHQEQGKAFVFEVSLCGFQLILNQTEPWTDNRAGHGRAFIARLTAVFEAWEPPAAREILNVQPLVLP